MSNYRVRQVMKLRRSQRQKDFLVGLATFMSDDGRSTRAGFDAVMEAAGQSRNTARLARRELEAAGDLASWHTGEGRGHVTEWAVLCLPEASPETQKGVSAVNPVSDVDPLLGVKGVNPVLERGSNGVAKGGQGQAADQEEPNTLNRSAKQSASLRPVAAGLHEALAAVVHDVTERETGAVVETLKSRGARSAGAVLRAEIRDGTAPDLVAEVRRQPALLDSLDRRPASIAYTSLCPRCSRLRHDPLPCPDLAAAEARARPVESPPLMAAVQRTDSTRCQYPKCPTRPALVGGDGYHDTCRYLADVKALAPPSAQQRKHPEAS